MSQAVPAQSNSARELRDSLPVGARLGAYEILSVLGQGGFGITYRARDTRLNRIVAIKEYMPTSLVIRETGVTVAPRSTALVEEFVWGRDRFLEEGRTLAKLEGAPGIVRVYDFLEANGTAYMVMAFLEGESLERRLRREGPLSQLVVERLLESLLSGLEAVHAVGFLHRDIKPDNIMLDARGTPTLIDFGAARAAIAGRTTAMTAIFTPGYAAAEQFASAKQGPFTDIYALSATLYHALTGQTPPSAFDRMLGDGYKPLAKLSPAGSSLDFLSAIDAGLAVRAADRPQSIADWRTMFRLGGPQIESAPRVAASIPALPGKRGRGRWIAAAAVLLLPLTGGAYYLLTVNRTDAPVFTATPIIDAEAVARKKADDEKAAQEAAARQQERGELAKLRAEATAREQAQKEEALKREVEEDMRQKLEAERAEKQRVEDASRQKVAAEEAARSMALANDHTAAEAAEAALRLGVTNRQHVQVALTALGFNTAGADGAFGPRTRDMILAWQTAENYAPTGFLTTAQNQALLQEASSAISRFDDDQRRAAAKMALQPPAPAPTAPANVIRNSKYLQREPANGTLSPGVRVLVDDSTCPPDQVLEVTGSQSTSVGRAKRCVARSD